LINHSGFFWSRDDGVAVASAIPCASHLLLIPDITQVFLQAGCSSCCPTNGVKALSNRRKLCIIWLVAFISLQLVWGELVGRYMCVKVVRYCASGCQQRSPWNCRLSRHTQQLCQYNTYRRSPHFHWEGILSLHASYKNVVLLCFWLFTVSKLIFISDVCGISVK